ncbi:hypothetical protein CEXT_795681 [Caerostris extrusa]|uniref:Uncharacterized protein n=1 Tax=Caerostris extrusa TaxID=172846 RepID=A0AAV4X9L7_CAEEX|nr:hypothetical protein CEXT_795681 [Caerostris extrusa]
MNQDLREDGDEREDENRRGGAKHEWGREGRAVPTDSGMAYCFLLFSLGRRLDDASYLLTRGWNVDSAGTLY